MFSIFSLPYLPKLHDSFSKYFTQSFSPLVSAPPVFGIGPETMNSTIIRIPFYSTHRVTEWQYNVSDSDGELRHDHKLMEIVDSNVTLTFHGYERSIHGQAFVWNISESDVFIPAYYSLSISNEFGTSVFQFYWQPLSSVIVGKFNYILDTASL